MTTVCRTDQRYLDRLGYHLQVRRVPEERIDDILAEARAHAVLSGESLREAFGAPGEYARRWAGSTTLVDRLPAVAGWIVGAIGSTALTVGAVAMADDRPVLGIAPVWLMAIGTVLLVGTAAVVPAGRLRDPLGSCRLRAGRRGTVATVLLACTIMVAAGFLGAWL